MEGKEIIVDFTDEGLRKLEQLREVSGKSIEDIVHDGINILYKLNEEYGFYGRK